MLKYIKHIFTPLLIVGFIMFGCSQNNNDSNSENISVNTLENISISDFPDQYSCTYNGLKHNFIVCMPSNYDENDKNIPVLFMLHDYGSTDEAFRLDTQTDKTLCPKGYAVVYVSGVSNPDDIYSSTGWNSGIYDSSIDDVGFLKALADFIHKGFNGDPEKMYIAGFRNGACMVHRLALEANDVFSGFISVSGMTPAKTWENRGEIDGVNFLQINGDKDDIVPMKINGTDTLTKDPAIEDTLNYYISSGGLHETERNSLSKKAKITKYSNASNNKNVWFVLIEGGRNSWPEEKISGFDTNSLILDFLNYISKTEE